MYQSLIKHEIYGPRREKICLWDVRQSEFQTSLLSYRDLLENLNFICSKFTYDIFQKANDKGPDQSARMRRLVCACVVCKLPKTGFHALSSYVYVHRLLILYISRNGGSIDGIAARKPVCVLLQIACSKFCHYTFHRANDKDADQTAWMRKLVCVFVVRIQPLKIEFQAKWPNLDTAYLFMQASQRFCQDVATEQLMNIEGEAIYPSASVSLKSIIP